VPQTGEAAVELEDQAADIVRLDLGNAAGEPRASWPERCTRGL
jgi:hypothetical protein